MDSSQSTSKNSSESRRLVLTASKFPQLVRCSRSVLEQPDYVVDRKSQPKNPAAARGVKIHSVLQTYAKTVNKELAQAKAKQLDCMSDFKKIDWQGVDYLLNWTGKIPTQRYTVPPIGQCIHDVLGRDLHETLSDFKQFFRQPRSKLERTY